MKTTYYIYGENKPSEALDTDYFIIMRVVDEMKRPVTIRRSAGQRIEYAPSCYTSKEMFDNTDGDFTEVGHGEWQSAVNQLLADIEALTTPQTGGLK